MLSWLRTMGIPRASRCSSWGTTRPSRTHPGSLGRFHHEAGERRHGQHSRLRAGDGSTRIDPRFPFCKTVVDSSVTRRMAGRPNPGSIRSSIRSASGHSSSMDNWIFPVHPAIWWRPWRISRMAILSLCLRWDIWMCSSSSGVPSIILQSGSTWMVCSKHFGVPDAQDRLHSLLRLCRMKSEATVREGEKMNSASKNLMTLPPW